MYKRQFLDRVIDVTYEIEYGDIKRYPGNYSAFVKQKEEAQIKQEKDYEAQQKEIERLTAWIEKWKNTPTKVAATRSKRMAIEHMVKIEKPRRFDTRTFHALFHPVRESYTDVLTMKKLKIGYDTVLSEVSAVIKKAERIVIIGENGKGKSTLLKTVVGEINPLGGSYQFGNRVDFAYFDQHKAVNQKFDPEQTVLDYFWSLYPNLLRNDVRSALGAFLFSGEDVEKKMGQLSGGEKVRLELCRIFYTKPNFLILDEPTASLTETESATLFQIMLNLKKQGYTCVLISHKLDEVFAYSDRIVVMRDGKVINNHNREEFDQSRIIAEMVGRKMDNLYPKCKVPVGEVVMEARDFSVPHPQNAKKKIVEDVSFTVRKGEILGIGGLVGAGRSELVNAVFGIIGKQSGAVMIDGREVQIRKPEDAIREGLALVTEDRKLDGFVGGMSIEENITLASLKAICRYGIINHKKEQLSARKYFDELKIKAADMTVHMETLSGGNQQKVIIAKWLFRDCDILLIDEPTQGIDVMVKEEIYKIIRNLADEGKSMIVVSSELDELLRICDNIIVMFDGKEVMTSSKENFNPDKILSVSVTGRNES